MTFCNGWPDVIAVYRAIAEKATPPADTDNDEKRTQIFAETTDLRRFYQRQSLFSASSASYFHISCDRSDLAVSYDLRVLDNAVLKTRIFLTIPAFIDVYYNPTNGICSYTLVQDNRRIYGADNVFIGWHIHPFKDPSDHRLCDEVEFDDFLKTVAQWVG